MQVYKLFCYCISAVFGSSDDEKTKEPEKSSENVQEPPSKSSGEEPVPDTEDDLPVDESGGKITDVTANTGDVVDSERKEEQSGEEEITQTVQDDNGTKKVESPNEDTLDEKSDKNAVESLKFIDDQGEAIESSSEENRDTDEKRETTEMDIQEEKIQESEDELAMIMSYLESGSISTSPSEDPMINTVEENPDQLEATKSNDKMDSTPEHDVSSSLMPVKQNAETTAIADAEQISETQATSTETENTFTDSITDEPLTSESTASVLVIDGTTFGSEYFSIDETVSVSASETPQVQASSTYTEEATTSQSDKISPTASYNIHDSTVASVNQNIAGSDHLTASGVSESSSIITSTDTLDHAATSSVASFSADTIQPSETIKDITESWKDEPIDPVQVLGTSFGFVTQSENEKNTVTTDRVQSSMGMPVIQHNETVESDNEHEQVQPSLDQNGYLTDIYLSRKPLSTGSSEASTGTVNKGDGVNNIPQEQSGGHSESVDTKVEKIDINNNMHQSDVNNNILEQTDENNNEKEQYHVTTTDTLPEYLTPPTPTELPREPNADGDRVLSRKIPDPELDEEVKQSSADLTKSLEPLLKALIEMVS